VTKNFQEISGNFPPEISELSTLVFTPKSHEAESPILRPEGQKIEAYRVDGEGRVLGEEATSPLHTSKGVWGTAVSSPRGVGS